MYAFCHLTSFWRLLLFVHRCLSFSCTYPSSQCPAIWFILDDRLRNKISTVTLFGHSFHVSVFLAVNVGMSVLLTDAATGGVLTKSQISQENTFVGCLLKACNFIKKETSTQVFSCEYCDTFKNTYFEEHLRTAASVNLC